MSPDRVALFAAAGAFAVASGANDGGALLATGLNLRSLRPLYAIGFLLLAVFTVPLVLGTTVASTLATELVAVGDAPGVLPFVVAVTTAGGVVAALSWFGLPTSLTLALIGSIAGAGVGFGLPVAWPLLIMVLGIALAAPVIGAMLSGVILAIARLLPERHSAATQLGVAHRLAYTAQCIAYAANDGQKMLAIFAVAAGTAEPLVAARPEQLAVIAGLFALGLVLGLPRLAQTLGRGILLLRPAQAVSAELASATAVLGSTAVGAPVSMTQSISGALIGSGLSEGYQRVRWRAAATLGLAWLLTLPTSLAASAVVGRLASELVR